MTDIRFGTAAPGETLVADAIVVPLFDDGAIPGGLSESVAATVRLMAPEVLAGPRFGVLSHFGADGRIVVVKGGSRARLDRLALRRLASSAVKALWTSQVRSVAIVLTDLPLSSTDAA